MKKKNLVIALFIFTASLMEAQSISIGPQLGFIKTKDADKAAIMPAVAVRLDLVSIEIEGSIGYKKDEYSDGQVKTTSYPILLTGMLSVFPFVHAEAGIGWYNNKIDYSNFSFKSETKQNIGYHIGAGAEVPLGNVVLTGDIRYVFLNIDFSNFTVSKESLKSDYYTLNIGLMFSL